MSDDIAIPLFAIGMPMMLAITVISLKHRARHREMRHREQMRALELGLPPGHGSPGAALVCTAVGAGVPIAALFFAMVTSVVARDGDVAAIAWPAAVVVGVGGLISGYRLANRLLAAGPPAGREAAPTKDVVDPDFYAYAGRRG